MPIRDREAHARRCSRRFTREEYIEMVREDVAVLGRVPGIDSWRDREDRPSSKSVRSRFGSWNALVAEAGFEPRVLASTPVTVWPAVDLLRLMRRDVDAEGRPPSMMEWRQREDRPDPSTAVARFGSWRALVLAAGARSVRAQGGAVDPVPNDALREAVLASGRPLSRIAYDVGFVRRKRTPTGVAGDDIRLKRVLGIRTSSNRGRRYVQKTISHDRALAIAAAIGVDPYEVGL